MLASRHYFFVFFFFNDTATTEIYTLSLHDALPIWWMISALVRRSHSRPPGGGSGSTVTAIYPVPSSTRSATSRARNAQEDRKSTRLNSSHANISYAVFCLKKKNNVSNTDIHNC